MSDIRHYLLAAQLYVERATARLLDGQGFDGTQQGFSPSETMLTGEELHALTGCWRPQCSLVGPRTVRQACLAGRAIGYPGVYNFFDLLEARARAHHSGEEDAVSDDLDFIACVLEAFGTDGFCNGVAEAMMEIDARSASLASDREQFDRGCIDLAMLVLDAFDLVVEVSAILREEGSLRISIPEGDWRAIRELSAKVRRELTGCRCAMAA